MHPPTKIIWFEILLYIALALDAISTMFQDRTRDDFETSTVVAGILILLQFYFVRFAAEHRVGWPRWALATVLVLSIVSLVNAIGAGEVLRAEILIEIVSCTLTAVGLYLSFTGSAHSWFDKK